MAHLYIEVAVILVLVLLNGIFSMSELAMMTARKARLQALASTGNGSARNALTLKENPGKFLSTVQIGITLIGVLSGAFAGATLAESLGTWLNSFEAFGDRGESVAVALVVIVITFLSLIFGELVPKQLALSNTEKIAMFVARPMTLLARICSPVVWVLTFVSHFTLKVLRVKEHSTDDVTEEEIRHLVREGRMAGQFEQAEEELIDRAFRLGERNVESFMTTRADLIWLNLNDSLNENLKKVEDSPHHFFPVCRGSINNVVGVLGVKQIWLASRTGTPIDLASLAEEAGFVLGKMSGIRLLEEFKSSHRSVALVVDEHGELQGIITINDLLEALVGDLPSVNAEDEVVVREDGTWLVDGTMSIEDFKERFQFNPEGSDANSHFSTVAGLLLSKFGSFPVPGQYCEISNYRFEVVDMDRQRIDKILVSRINDGELIRKVTDG